MAHFYCLQTEFLEKLNTLLLAYRYERWLTDVIFLYWCGNIWTGYFSPNQTVNILSKDLLLGSPFLVNKNLHLLSSFNEQALFIDWKLKKNLDLKAVWQNSNSQLPISSQYLHPPCKCLFTKTVSLKTIAWRSLRQTMCNLIISNSQNALQCK